MSYDGLHVEIIILSDGNSAECYIPLPFCNKLMVHKPLPFSNKLMVHKFDESILPFIQTIYVWKTGHIYRKTAFNFLIGTSKYTFELTFDILIMAFWYSFDQAFDI